MGKEKYKPNIHSKGKFKDPSQITGGIFCFIKESFLYLFYEF